MRIEQQKSVTELIQPNNSKTVFTEKTVHTKAKCSKNQSVFVKDSTYLNPALEEKKNLMEELQEETSLDATARKNQMAVLSHTTSEEDYAKMQEDGFSLDATSGSTIVTVIDKIKAEIAKAGGDISCFGDDLSKEQLEELTGNDALASQIKHALKRADLPITKENVEDCMKAYVLASNLPKLDEGGIKYMLDNELAPTIENFYKAAYCGSGSYVTPACDPKMEDINELLAERIHAVGFPTDKQTLEDGSWLLANEIPLTTDHLAYLQDLKEYQGGCDADRFVEAMVQAIAEGNRPKDGMLLFGYDKASQAKEAVTVITNATDSDLAYLIDQGKKLTISNLKAARNQGKEAVSVEADDIRFVTAKRQLEETRLWMSTEANYALLKKGVSIDTKPLVELVEELKQQEHAYYKQLLTSENVEPNEENIEIFAETTEKLNEMKLVPAYVVGLAKEEVTHIRGIHEKGMAMKAALELANQRYEPLLSAPRKDLGDSYEKAFRNVDVLLEELGFTQSEENRRAVRILAYNQTEISEESLLRVKAADEEVQRVFKNLTPRVVIEMIRKGKNPLEMDFQSINETADAIREELDGDDTERFSKYLWKLEQSHEITEEERSSYIGIYRLLHQVEKTDGAAIGALLWQGREITLKNLLTAVRSSQKKGTSFSEPQEGGYKNSIIDQIMAGYQSNCVKDAKEALTPSKFTWLKKQEANWIEMTPEQLASMLKESEGEEEPIESAYRNVQLALMEQCAMSSTEVYEMLEQYDIPNTIQNVLAMEELLRDRNQVYKKLFEAKEQMLDAFAKAVSSPEEMAKAQETLAKVAEQAMKTVLEDEEIKAIDIREARLMRTQIQIQKRMAKKDTYSIPVLIGEEVTNVTLKIVHGVEKKGMVDIMLESRISGKIAASFQAKENQVIGTIVTDSPETKATLKMQMEHSKMSLQETGEAWDVKIAYMKELDMYPFLSQQGIDSEDSASNADTVTTTRLYRIAESFIRMVKESYK